MSDDDHPNRPDISVEEFTQTLNEIKTKFGLKPKKTIQEKFRLRLVLSTEN